MEFISFIFYMFHCPFLILWAISLLFLRHKPLKIIYVLGLIIILIGIPVTADFSWSLRDGMGPDSVESHGSEAWSRFWEEMIPYIKFLLLIITVSTTTLIIKIKTGNDQQVVMSKWQTVQFILGWSLTLFGVLSSGLTLYTGISPEFNELGGTQAEFIKGLITSTTMLLAGIVTIILLRKKLNSQQEINPNQGMDLTR